MRERDTIAPADVPDCHKPKSSPETTGCPGVPDPRREYEQHDEPYES